MALVLIVDDSSFQRRRIQRLVERLGHQTAEATGGKQALEMIPRQRPDYVLLDLIMPDLGGLQALKALQQQRSKVPVIVLTADVQEPIRKECMDLGAVDVLHKPPRFEDIQAALEKLTENKGAGA
jgi:CheY-like chemotaxis protein